MKKVFFFILLLVAICVPVSGEEKEKPKMAVEVVDCSEEMIGNKIYLYTKLFIETSETMRITTVDEHRVQVLIISMSSLPDVGEGISANYSIIWLAAGKGMKNRYYLYNRIGICGSGKPKEVAEYIALETANVLSYYIRD